MGINASGQVVGFDFLNQGSGHAFRTTATGNFSDPAADLGPGAAFAINAAGQATGDKSPNGHAFRTTANGNLSDPASDLGTLSNSGIGGRGLALNASGRVAGYSESFPTSVAFRTTATGDLTDPSADLGTLPNDVGSAAQGINSLDVVVGYSNDASGVQRAVIVDGSGMRDLNDLVPAGSGWQLLQAKGISDTGFIVGIGTINGFEHGFLLTPIPVPEPSTLALTGLVSALLVRRRFAGRHN